MAPNSRCFNTLLERIAINNVRNGINPGDDPPYNCSSTGNIRSTPCLNLSHPFISGSLV